MAKLDAIGPGEASVNARTLDDRTWIVAYSAAEAPATYYRYDRADGGGELTELFSSRPALDGKPLVPMWPQEIKSRDGLTLVSYLSLPKTRSEEHTSELQSLMRISYAVFCLKKKTQTDNTNATNNKHSRAERRTEQTTVKRKQHSNKNN